MTQFSLAFLTIPDVDPITAIRIAAMAGYEKIGIRLLPATPEEKPYPLLFDRQLQRDVRSALYDNAISIGDVELIRIRPSIKPSEYLHFFDAAKSLEASQVIVVGDDTDKNRTIDNYAELCDLSAPFGLTLNLEPMPWAAISDLSDASEIVFSSGRGNSGILIDAFHFYRRSTDLKVIETIESRYLNIFQICDAPQSFQNTPDAIRNEARTARLVPGDGELDLKSLISRLPKSTVVSIEVPNKKYIEEIPPFERSLRCLRATKTLYHHTKGEWPVNQSRGVE